ncbi:hypothetical protein ACJ41O_007619 [Fusarium nematophilum]
METWHDGSCRRPDLLSSGGMVSCLNCGSFQVEDGLASAPASTPQNQHTYQPLVSATDLRLLTLYPGEGDDPIQCSLSPASLSSPLEYDAISYTWADESGNQERDSFVLLGGVQFPVTSNCTAALRRVRRRGTSRPIWVDAICIDQEKDLERNHQVRLMPQIYARAQSVLIYIGEPTLSETELLVFLEYGADAGADWLHFNRALQTLFTRRWFSRVWVLQEVILSSEALLLFGTFTLPWSSFQVSRLKERGILGLDNDLNWLPPILRIQPTRYTEPGELVKLLDLVRSSHASDPRDKVFAVLGFLLNAEADGLVADYTKSTREVYSHIAERVASKYGLPALLARSLWAERTRDSDPWRLEPWVPDWTERLPAIHPQILGREPFHGSLPIRVDPGTGTIRFPACDVTRYMSAKPWGPLPDGSRLPVPSRRFPSRYQFPETTVAGFWMIDYAEAVGFRAKTAVVRFGWKPNEALPGAATCLFLYEREMAVSTIETLRYKLVTPDPVSIYLLPEPQSGEDTEFMDGLDVDLSWSEKDLMPMDIATWGVSGPLSWTGQGGGGEGSGGGKFSRFALCVAHERSGQSRFCGIFPFSDSEKLLSALGGKGILRHLTLRSDLSLMSRDLSPWMKE